MKMLPDTLVCPECKKLGLKSKVFYEGYTKTLLAWHQGHYDEDGKWQEHPDPNICTAGFHCSNKHWITIKYREGQGEIERSSGTIGEARG